MVCLYEIIAILILTVITIRWLKIKDPEPIFNVYQRPSKWYYLKYAVAHCCIVLLKYLRSGSSSKNGATPGYGLKSKADIADMDKLQPLAKDAPLAVDAVFFTGASKEGFYFNVGMARRPNNIVNSFWQIRIPDVGLLVSPKHPDTTLTAVPNAFSAEGMTIVPIEPMKKWKISYNGEMKFHDDKDNKLIPVSMQLDWHSGLPYFDFDTDMAAAPTARAIAREPWTRTYFEGFKKAHQTHYEHMGNIKGTLKIEGYGEFKVDLNSMRDHSYSRERDWTLIHRYALHNITVEDGTKFMVGVLSMPKLFSSCEIGYLYTPEGELFGIESCDFELYEHGEQGNPPRDYSFTLTANGKQYLVQVEVVESPEVYIGLDWECRLIERMCRFRVNGKQGWGFSEWEYRNHEGCHKQDTYKYI